MQDLQMPAAGLQLFTFKNLQLDSIKTSCRPPSRSDLGVKTGLLRLTQPRRHLAVCVTRSRTVFRNLGQTGVVSRYFYLDHLSFEKVQI